MRADAKLFLLCFENVVRIVKDGPFALGEWTRRKVFLPGAGAPSPEFHDFAHHPFDIPRGLFGLPYLCRLVIRFFYFGVIQPRQCQDDAHVDVRECPLDGVSALEDGDVRLEAMCEFRIALAEKLMFVMGSV